MPSPDRARTAVGVTYDSAGDIGACLTALAGERVVVVDNASSDGTADLVARDHPGVTLVRSPRNVGFARAVNQGIELARRGDDLVLVNPDAVVAPDTLDRLAAALDARPEVGIAVPRLRHPDGRTQESVRSFKTVPALLARRTPLGRTAWGRRQHAAHVGVADATSPQPVDWAIGALLYVRRDALEQVGPLDERFFLYEEDLDWCARMWAAGWEVRYHPEIEAVHGYRRASHRTWDLRVPATRHHWRSILRLAAKHPGIVLLGRSPRRAGR